MKEKLGTSKAFNQDGLRINEWGPWGSNWFTAKVSWQGDIANLRCGKQDPETSMMITIYNVIACMYLKC
jgi:hypothetical protein